MKLPEKIKRAKELNDTLSAQANLPTSERMDDKEWQIVVNEINSLDIQIKAEESLEGGEWKKDMRDMRTHSQLRKESKTHRYNI